MEKNYRYLFGPVPSRRFGWSLGVDLIPFKTCPLDCIFCQLGRTTNKTTVQKEYTPVAEVQSEIEYWLKKNGEADYITLSGSGEPTLHSKFGDVLKFMKRYPIPVVLLTNGALLHRPQVREAAANADIVKVSMSVWDQQSFQWLNRPCPDLTFESLLDGQKAFRKHFKGEIWLEVFLVLGVNSMPKNVEKIAACVQTIQPDRIHLNTAVRPPAEEFTAPLSKERMESLALLFDPPVEVIAEFRSADSKNFQANEDAILAMLQRRPCTMDQIAKTFGMHVNEASKYLGKLMRGNQIRTYHGDTSIYYTAVMEAPA